MPIYLQDVVRAADRDAEVTIINERSESETDNEDGSDRNDEVQQELQRCGFVWHGDARVLV